MCMKRYNSSKLLLLLLFIANVGWVLTSNRHSLDLLGRDPTYNTLLCYFVGWVMTQQDTPLSLLGCDPTYNTSPEAIFFLTQNIDEYADCA